MKSKTVLVVLYTILFFALWTVCELYLSPFLDKSIPSAVLLRLIKDGLIKNLLWTIPALLLIRYRKNDVYISLKEMFTKKVAWRNYLPIFLFFTAYLLVGAAIQNGKIEFVRPVNVAGLVSVMFVGITEELVFRGYLLNVTLGEQRKWFPVILNSILFLFIHFPIWISTGVFLENFANLGFLCVLGLSIIFSWSFIKSRNILVPICLHTYWDLLMVLFY